MLVESMELSIQILPTETGPEVSGHYAVRVEHWHYLEDEIGAEL